MRDTQGRNRSFRVKEKGRVSNRPFPLTAAPRH